MYYLSYLCRLLVQMYDALICLSVSSCTHHLLDQENQSHSICCPSIVVSIAFSSLFLFFLFFSFLVNHCLEEGLLPHLMIGYENVLFMKVWYYRNYKTVKDKYKCFCLSQSSWKIYMQMRNCVLNTAVKKILNIFNDRSSKDGLTYAFLSHSNSKLQFKITYRKLSLGGFLSVLFLVKVQGRKYPLQEFGFGLFTRSGLGKRVKKGRESGNGHARDSRYG